MRLDTTAIRERWKTAYCAFPVENVCVHQCCAIRALCDEVDRLRNTLRLYPGPNAGEFALHTWINNKEAALALPVEGKNV